ncbi:hypothetical protein P6B95_15495 [Streptomyces atratus]|uniref:hypothetical protein n=1 Tax=Streptomyces atratus TaxID=1893 RepID=UPI001670B4A6|nr:hypothetical protein [Streptomyces atratus]WPW28652.1 hypothetical protein P6B95_15495 [Streptomyces atratus]GGT74525.1 hypothetical protein GCM10010207_84910 [Streptomyces atratus]
MADDVDGSARIRITLDDSGVAAEARALGVRIKGAIDRGMRGVGRDLERQLRAVQITVTPNLRRFDAQLLAGLRSLESINVPVSPDLTGFVERLRAALAGEELSVRVVPDLGDFDARLRGHNMPTLNVPVNPDVNNFTRALRGLTSLASGAGSVLASALQFGAIGGAALAAAAGIASFVGSLAPAIGIVAALPAVIGGVVVANSALKLALSGVGDAFGAALGDDAEKFEKSLENLSPAAQAAARELRALKPQFDSLKSTVQDAFFAPLKGQITGVAQALSGPLKSGLAAVAGNFGLAAQRVGFFLQSATGIKSIQGILQGTTQATSGLAAAIGPVVSGLTQVAGAVSKAFGAQTGNAIASLGARLGGFLQQAAQGGQAVAWVQGALGVFRQLGAVVGQVGGILGDVFGALAAGGGGSLGALTQVLTTVRSLIQPLLPLITQLAQLFSTVLGGALSTLAAVLGPVISLISSTLMPLIPALSIVGMFSGLGGKIVAAIGDIGSKIMGKIKGGLPSSVRGLLPFANGGIVTGPTPALIGEAGPEVVIPLTRPARARQLAEQSGLADLLAAASTPKAQGSAARPGAVITNHWTIHEAGDAHMTARRVLNRMTLAAGVV